MTKTKGISIWEQYVEFAVVGLVCVLFVVFVAMQFVGRPNVVTVANHGDVGPGEVDAFLEDEARRISARLQPDADPGPEISPPESIADDFLARLDRRVTPASPQIPPLAYVPLGVGERIPPEAIFTVPEIPTPKSIVSRQYFDALEPGIVESDEALQEQFDAPPYDLTWTTVAGTFNLGEVLNQYRQGGPDGDPAPVPQSWHNDRATVVNIIVEREELVDGQWGNRTMLAPIPGQFHVREHMQGEIDSSLRDMILRLVRPSDAQRDLVQPSFLPTQNDSWQPPDPLADDLDAAADDDQRVRILQRQIARARAELETLQADLDSMPTGRPRDGDRDGRQPPGGGRTPGGGGRTPGGGGRPGGPPGVGGDPPGDGPRGTGRDRGPDATRANLEQRIARLERQIERYEDRLRELRPDFDVEAVEADLLELDEVTIWMHDMHITPGKDYRYRMAVELYNPFFGRTLHLVPEQEHLADGFVMQSEFSNWSDPITIRPPVHVFVTRAYPPGHERLGGVMGRTLGEASIEVFRFYDGRWWDYRFTVEPGQRVGDRRESGPRGEDGPVVDYGTEWFVLDILPDLNATSRQFEDGRGAVVVLQHLRNGEIMEIRHPLTDMESDLRRHLRDEMQIAARQ